ncbi:hypothetical protein FO519_009555 [Halicephalobus sp. NKZ332]|nr:hypothetical protein FO519_009555 [Halicephalobus sp. NKZ332]
MFKIIFLSIIIVFAFVDSTCPDGTYVIPSILGSNWPCMLLSNDTAIYTYAERVCEEHNGHLLPIPNAFVDAFVADLIRIANLSRPVGIGVTRLLGGIWRNVDDGTNTTYFNWGVEQPNNITGCNCAYIYSNDIWAAGVCENVNYYACGVPGTGETGFLSL